MGLSRSRPHWCIQVDDRDIDLDVEVDDIDVDTEFDSEVEVNTTVGATVRDICV